MKRMLLLAASLVLFATTALGLSPYTAVNSR